MINPAFAGGKGIVYTWKCLKMQFYFRKVTFLIIAGFLTWLYGHLLPGDERSLSAAQNHLQKSILHKNLLGIGVVAAPLQYHCSGLDQAGTLFLALALHILVLPPGEGFCLLYIYTNCKLSFFSWG